MRSSLLVVSSRTRLVIDTGPELRLQLIRERVTSLDGVLLTHDHADHLNGLDDLRVFCREGALPVFGRESTLESVKKRFDYVFTPQYPGGGKPVLDLHPIDEQGARVGDIAFTEIPIRHGCRTISGFRFGDTAYLTDCSGIPEESLDGLKGIRNLIIGALRFHQHPTHFTIPQAIEASRQIGAERTWLTHLCHDVDHGRVSELLPEDVRLAYDGLRITAHIS